jgi:hypothetical protein
LNIVEFSFSLIFDLVAPTVVLTTTLPDISKETVFRVSFLFDEIVRPLTGKGAMRLTSSSPNNPNLLNFVAGQSEWTVDVRVADPVARISEVITVMLIEHAAVDRGGLKSNAGANVLVRTLDREPPTLRIFTTSINPSLTKNLDIGFKFSESVRGFSVSSVIFIQANLDKSNPIVLSASSFTPASSLNVTTVNTTWTAKVLAKSDNCLLLVSIDTKSFITDAANNMLITPQPFELRVDTKPPQVTAKSTLSPDNPLAVVFTFTFDEPVTPTGGIAKFSVAGTSGIPPSYRTFQVQPYVWSIVVTGQSEEVLSARLLGGAAKDLSGYGC